MPLSRPTTIYTDGSTVSFSAMPGATAIIEDSSGKTVLPESSPARQFGQICVYLFTDATAHHIMTIGFRHFAASRRDIGVFSGQVADGEFGIVVWHEGREAPHVSWLHYPSNDAAEPAPIEASGSREHWVLFKALETFWDDSLPFERRNVLGRAVPPNELERDWYHLTTDTKDRIHALCQSNKVAFNVVRSHIPSDPGPIERVSG